MSFGSLAYEDFPRIPRRSLSDSLLRLGFNVFVSYLHVKYDDILHEGLTVWFVGKMFSSSELVTSSRSTECHRQASSNRKATNRIPRIEYDIISYCTFSGYVSLSWTPGQR